ncbi:hypothetical protein B9Z19DRAFT_1192558 [Tuber borchii]|uniref:Cyanovirin-N domain-containing protein n=1 Tax=Tuber borchii TaxID=42251 RepID=A0A2T6ZVF9_TUBBO|nr:hypothetical protein B9Z19DRAFT_1192558 [Tuber borchii]
MGLTKDLGFTLLLIVTSALLTSSTPIPNSPAELSSSDLAELAIINQKSFSITLPLYKLSEDGAAELLGETAATGRLLCETSAGSPYIWDTYMASSQLNRVGWCQQLNPGGSRCTLHSRFKTAALSLCGTWLLAVRCQELALVGNLITDHCRFGARAGGQYYFDENPGLLKGVVHWNDV